jgi:hypothetical protein
MIAGKITCGECCPGYHHWLQAFEFDQLNLINIEF